MPYITNTHLALLILSCTLVFASCSKPEHTEESTSGLHDTSSSLTSEECDTGHSCCPSIDQDGDYMEQLKQARDSGQITPYQYEISKANLLENLSEESSKTSESEHE